MKKKLDYIHSNESDNIEIRLLLQTHKGHNVTIL